MFCCESCRVSAQSGEQRPCESKILFVTTPTSPQTIPSAFDPVHVSRLVNWNICNTDTNVIYNAVNGEFTVSQAGVYSVSVYITWDNTAGGIRELTLYRVPAGCPTGSAIASDTRVVTLGYPTRVTLTTDVKLNSCDRIYATVWQNSGSAVQVFPPYQNGNKFSIVKYI